MPIKSIVVALALGFTCVAKAAGLMVADSPDWRPASEAQRKVIASNPECLVIDFSVCTTGGAGSILQTPAKSGTNKQFVEGSVSGYVNGGRQHGQTMISQSPAAVGKLRGVCVTSGGEAKGRAFGIVSYLVYSNRDMYVISVYGPGGLTAADPLVGRYLARIKIDSSVAAGDIESDSAYERGTKFGALVVKVAFFIGLTVVLVVAIVVMLMRRGDGKPPPLPRNA